MVVKENIFDILKIKLLTLNFSILQIYKDENLLKNTLKNSIINNFCIEQDTENENNINERFNSSHDNDYLIGSYNDGSTKPKKVVTFKAGLINERNSKAYKGALITKEQVWSQKIFFL